MTDFPSLAEVQTTAWTPRSPPALGLIAIGVARDRLIGVIAWGFGPLSFPKMQRTGLGETQDLGPHAAARS